MLIWGVVKLSEHLTYLCPTRLLALATPLSLGAMTASYEGAVIQTSTRLPGLIFYCYYVINSPTSQTHVHCMTKV